MEMARSSLESINVPSRSKISSKFDLRRPEFWLHFGLVAGGRLAPDLPKILDLFSECIFQFSWRQIDQPARKPADIRQYLRCFEHGGSWGRRERHEEVQQGGDDQRSPQDAGQRAQ